MQLTTVEQVELTQHEQVIERGLRTFVEVGLALMAIRDGRLYRTSAGTFEAYCQSRWGLERVRAYQIMNAAAVVENVKTFIQPPAVESQAAALVKLKEPEQQREAWQRAVETAPSGKLTAAHVKKVVTEFVRQERGQDTAPPFPTGTYSVIYADPPWSYSNSGFTQSAASHYPTMSTAEICALPVGGLCTDDSVLFLWATSPLLNEAFEVIEAWGFTYKASIVWDKGRSPGLGWFVQTEHELLLVATREANTHPNIKPKSIVRLSASRHSAKPDGFYELIESMYSGPYCELFARNARERWFGWGNESGRKQPLSSAGKEDAAVWRQAVGVGGGLEQGQMGAFLSGSVSHN